MWQIQIIMNIPQEVKELAKAHGFNSVELVKRTSDEHIYSVGCVDSEGFCLPTGLPHYIIDHRSVLSFVCDNDFLITDVL